MTAVAVVVGVWVFFPRVLAVGNLRLPFGLRQAGLATGAAGVLARYVALRRKARERPVGALKALATPLFGVCLVLSSANWLVSVAAVVMVATDAMRRVGGSSEQGSAPSDRPPDSE